MEIIKIKCPWCNAVLSVKDSPENKGKTVTCPVCKRVSKFSEFKIVTQVTTEESTQYGFVTPEQDCSPIGRILSINDGKTFQLNLGRNVIGRKASNTSASIQIETGSCKRMSREHLVIDVKNIPNKGLTHYVSLIKEKVNETFVAGQQLVFGDCITLKHGDKIELPGCALMFEIPDIDATEI